MAALLLPVGNETLIGSDLLVKAGAVAAVLVLIGLALVAPLFWAHRREIERLVEWQEREPERGEGFDPAPSGVTDATTGGMSPAERVTADRPALERITTEREAIGPQARWQRLLARGPRHPLVVSAAALALAVAAIAAVALTGGLDSEADRSGGGLDRSEVDLVVLNASERGKLGERVKQSVSAAGFTSVRTGTTGTSRQTLVLFAPNERRAARVVSRELGVKVVQKMDRATRAIAPAADVVVVAGEDFARA